MSKEPRDTNEPLINWRTVAIVLLVGLLFWSWVTPVSGEESVDDKKVAPRKLQIGIKKRVENCERKSRKGDLLHIHYRGRLEETGAEFDSSYKRGNPLTFTLGQGQVIQGWERGLIGACEGEKRKLVIPPELAYGSQGAPPSIPPDAVLVFEVEVVKIDDSKNEL